MDPLAQLHTTFNAQNLWDSELELQRNQYLKSAGSTDTKLYWIIKGSVRIYVLDHGQENIIRFGYKNDLIAALDSFIKEGPSDLYIQAIKKTKLKVAHKNTFIDFVNCSTQNMIYWRQLLERIIAEQLERERDILTSSPLERYQRVLARSPQLFQEIPHKYIASYLRMTPETLSRIKKS